MSPQVQTIQLSVEEGLEFSRFTNRVEGFVAGVQAMAGEMKRMRIEEILKSRNAKPSEPTTAPPQQPENPPFDS